jgi:hypothetical protein
MAVGKVFYALVVDAASFPRAKNTSPRRQVAVNTCLHGKWFIGYLTNGLVD